MCAESHFTGFRGAALAQEAFYLSVSTSVSNALGNLCRSFRDLRQKGQLSVVLCRHLETDLSESFIYSRAACEDFCSFSSLPAAAGVSYVTELVI